MNKNFFAGLFAGLCLLAIFAFKPAAEKPEVAVQKWEYKITMGGWVKREAELNEAGAQGWELIQFEGGYWVFKRPVQ